MTTVSWAGGGRCLLLAFLCLGATLVVGEDAELRSWTNQQGRTIQAALIRVDGEMVVMRFQGKEVSVPLNTLSAADQHYVASQQTTAGSAESLKAAQLAAKRELRRVRKWTDRKGKSTFSSFVRIHQGDLVLKRGKTEQSRPFDEFCDEDQAFVKEHLELGGETDMLADLESVRMAQLAVEEARSREIQAANIRSSARSSVSPNSSSPLIPSLPPMPEMSPLPEPLELPSRSTIARSEMLNEHLSDKRQRQQEAVQELRELQERLAQQRREAIERFNQRTQQQQQATREMLEPSQPQLITSSERMVFCSNCDNEVPVHTKPGDTCPHCGERFVYVQDDAGNRTYTNGLVVRPVNWKVRLGLFISATMFALVAVGGGVVLWIIYH